MQCRESSREWRGCRRTLWLVLRSGFVEESTQEFDAVWSSGGAKPPNAKARRVKEVDRCPGLAGSLLDLPQLAV